MTTEAKKHCPDHAAYNEYCPSCIEANRAKAPAPTQDKPKDEPQHEA